MAMAWAMPCTNSGLALRRISSLVQLFHQRIQGRVGERGRIPQPGVGRIRAKNLLHGTLKQRQFKEHSHGFKRFGSHRLPTAFVGGASRREKKDSLFEAGE